MFEQQERKRYSRQILLPEMGLIGQERLKAAKVLVVGAGGLGCPVLQYLVAAGVGNIGIVDDDVVDMTNLHRQILYSAADVGKSKVLAAVEKLEAQNPFVTLIPHQVRLQEDNVNQIIANYDLVIDGSDNFPTRYLVNDACVELDKPLIFGSILRFEGQVSVFNYKGGPTYRCLFPDAEEGDNCAEAGVIGILPGIIGTYMANEAIKIICEIGNALSGRLLVMNALTNTTNIFEFSRSEQTSPPTPRTKESANLKNDPLAEPSEMTYEEFERIETSYPGQIHLVDVREYNEFEADNFGGVNIPLSEIPDIISTLPPNKTIVFYCQTGKRSTLAAKLLMQSGFNGASFWAGNW
ncbi:HesA/MoeB/ThiF family protein [Dyadobacter psychrophilus]|uniref:Molybdopterin-synthase adenylyltransferase n=1 Tax=Dyadobacter psychrophilus TaxID=651661 RepID=A0A1T5BCP6_9BACT|nr:HesA/MoeB/ThiF family protein [Dyadobacter psychrophilus]SKB44770.1 adenylyltransferase and sulfurtransferase [Dyadobacter psychrophilus]